MLLCWTRVREASMSSMRTRKAFRVSTSSALRTCTRMALSNCVFSGASTWGVGVPVSWDDSATASRAKAKRLLSHFLLTCRRCVCLKWMRGALSSVAQLACEW